MENAPENPDKPNTPPPNLPKPNIPAPNLPKPNIPAPSIPKPSAPVAAGPPVMVTANVPPKVEAKVEEIPEESDGCAPFNTRILAALIDMMVSAGLTFFLLWILPAFAGKIAWLVGMAYLVTRDALPFLGGQSVGKKAMNLRAVTRDGEPLTGKWQPTAIRNAVLVIPFFPVVELIVLLTREDKPEHHGLRLGDEWAKTRVIVEPPKPAPDEESA